jgi:aspartate/glutamate racemase
MACRRVKRVQTFDAVPLSAAQGSSHTYLFRQERFLLEAFYAYRRYQSRAAKAYEVESQRPHILVDVGSTSATRTICMVGGMGPLSDASIALQCARRLSGGGGDVRIVVVSVPPPRDETFGMLAYLRCLLVTIGGRLPKGRTCECYLASNTAHVAFPVFRATLYSMLPNVVPYDLVDATSRFLVAKYAGRVDAVVLLTTKVAWRARLYEQPLLSIARLVRATDSEIDAVQSLVDIGKRGGGGGGAFQDMLAFIGTKTRAKTTRYLIFAGCTDFRFLVPNQMSLRRQIQQRFPQAFVEDSDEVFSRLAAAGPPFA